MTNALFPPKIKSPLWSCPFGSPHPTTLSTMNARQADSKKFTNAVYCRSVAVGTARVWRWRLLGSATPHEQRKDGSHTENEGCAPGKSIQAGTKGSPCKPGPGIGAPTQLQGLVRLLPYGLNVGIFP